MKFLSEYFDRNYEVACELQNNTLIDFRMIEMIQSDKKDSKLVYNWMNKYGLFQGINNDTRYNISKTFLKLYPDIKLKLQSTNTIEEVFIYLFTSFYKIKQRSWLSATSKLLWCVSPNNIVIYDSFVSNSLTVIQSIEQTILIKKRIGIQPELNSVSDISKTASFYMNYQDIVKIIFNNYNKQFFELKNKYSIAYPYDLRILDKLLWMMGNPKFNFDTG